MGSNLATSREGEWKYTKSFSWDVQPYGSYGYEKSKKRLMVVDL